MWRQSRSIGKPAFLGSVGGVGMVGLRGWIEVLVELIELEVLIVYFHSHASFRRWGRYPGLDWGVNKLLGVKLAFIGREGCN